jgi:hypothetical protein
MFFGRKRKKKERKKCPFQKQLFRKILFARIARQLLQESCDTKHATHPIGKIGTFVIGIRQEPMFMLEMPHVTFRSGMTPIVPSTSSQGGMDFHPHQHNDVKRQLAPPVPPPWTMMFCW